jgi:uncharacterized protein YaaN involved in tellurite resistance
LAVPRTFGGRFPGLAGLLRRWLYGNDLARKRANPEQFMSAQCHSETVNDQIENKHQENVRASLANSRTQHEVRQQTEIERRLRETRQLQSMISNLEREVANLDDSIISELALSSVREPSAFAHPISARMMQARRENLKTTIAALSYRLSRCNQPVAEPDSGLKINTPFHSLGRTLRLRSRG